MDICLKIMTREQNRVYWRNFEHDPAMFQNPSDYQQYKYSEGSAEASWERQIRLGRVHLAVLLDGTPIGEVILKNINQDEQSCTLGIHLQNDAVKNLGYGTQAEILALEYAFKELHCRTVYADALRGNTRSQHVLKKVGFVPIDQDADFLYYRCDRSSWRNPGKDGFD